MCRLALPISLRACMWPPRSGRAASPRGSHSSGVSTGLPRGKAPPIHSFDGESLEVRFDDWLPMLSVQPPGTGGAKRKPSSNWPAISGRGLFWSGISWRTVKGRHSVRLWRPCVNGWTQGAVRLQSKTFDTLDKRRQNLLGTPTGENISLGVWARPALG